MKPTIEVRASHGFSHNWVLVLPATKKHPAQRFWLGQDVKFCDRVLGMSRGRIREEVNDLLGRDGGRQVHLYLPSHNQALAQFIVSCLGGTRHLRKQEPWALACQ